MKIRHLNRLLVFVITVTLWTGCRTEFERVRTSNDPDKVYEKAVAYYEEGEYLKAQTLLELILNNFRGTAKAEDLYFKYAYTHYHMKNFLLAAHYFDNFSNTFTSSDLRQEADYLRGYSNYLLSPNHRLDQEYTRKAIEQFQLYANTYPNSDRTDEINTLIDEAHSKLEQKEFDQGMLYYDLRNYNSAVHTFENLLKDFPETANAEQIRFLIFKSAFLLAENSFFERQQERFEEALEKFESFKKKFPASEYMAEASSMERSSRARLKFIAQ